VHIAAELVAGVGLVPDGDTNAVRRVAVRRDDYGVHVVATLLRHDGRTAWAWKDKTNSRRVAKESEDRYGLLATGPSDRMSHQSPGPKECCATFGVSM
jgi:hypothetical protein